MPPLIVDYGLGNLFSISRALRRVGGREVEITSDPARIATAQRLVLPGVGAFGDGMRGLRERGLLDAVKAFAATGRPLLGICLGMQLLMDEGTEFGVHPGLGLIAGRTVPFPAAEGRALKIPHVGWNGLADPRGRRDWAGTLFEGLSADSQVYFVHSFVAAPTDGADTLAVSAYGGKTFCAATRRGNIYGCQFHPEKSGNAGLRILKNFLNIAQETTP